MTVDELKSYGCYLNAGFMDIYDGKRHIRIGEASVTGGVSLTREGQAFVEKKLEEHFYDVVNADPDNEAQRK
jgi:hypothetical protein